MTDQVFVRALALHAYHGVMQHEAKVGQTFKLDLTLELDLDEASRTDKRVDTGGSLLPAPTPPDKTVWSTGPTPTGGKAPHETLPPPAATGGSRPPPAPSP